MTSKKNEAWVGSPSRQAIQSELRTRATEGKEIEREFKKMVGESVRVLVVIVQRGGNGKKKKF